MVQSPIGADRNGARDLEFLRFFPELRQFGIHEYELTSLDGLRYLPDNATRISIGSTSRPLSLLPLRRFRELQTLGLERQHRDLEVIGELRLLEDLTLRSMTLPDLTPLLPLERLRSLAIKLGGTRDLRLLPRIGRLTYLELWLIRGLEDVDAIGDIVTLEELYLQALKRVTHLPSFRRLGRLRKVHLETMGGLTDLSGVAEAPALEVLWLTDFRHAQPDIARPFIGHPNLRETGWGLGGAKKNFAAQELVPLDPELKDREAVEAWIRDVRARIRREASGARPTHPDSIGSCRRSAVCRSPRSGVSASNTSTRSSSPRSASSRIGGSSWPTTRTASSTD